MLARTAGTLFRQGQAAATCYGLNRLFSASAAPSKSSNEIKLPAAPTQLSGTSSSIATFVWQLAAKENVLEKVQDELHQVAEAFRQHEALARIAVDPFVPTVVRKSIVERIIGKSSETTSITKKLFVSLAEENCLTATFQIASAYDELMLAHKKEVFCTIITAQKLDKKEREDFLAQAKAFVAPGYKLAMTEKVDKKILGGFILEFEDRLVDMSVAKKMDEFNNLVNKLETEMR